ncbi:MAG: PD40 domain-containing protein [Bacteroidetes bacterium]|nr:PD40 domain-containing protein [Bacteroidota bacterium]
MESTKKLFWLFVLFFGILSCIGCKTEVNENVQELDRKPNIEPDYSGVTIPPNIAPMNFIIKEDGNFFKITATAGTNEYQIDIKSSDGIIRFPEKSWRKLINNCLGDKIEIQVYSSKKEDKSLKKYMPIYMNVANEPIDPSLVYRLIHPGYYSWSKMKIVQRSLENFREESLIENQLLEKNCVNCHSFNQNNPDRFLVHIRGSKGGTYFVEDDKITRTALKTKNMSGGATYPSWHPDGRYVAFSSNQVRQNFYAHAEKSIEVYDLASTLILYDRNDNEIINITEKDSVNHLQTFPSWSPDGRYLYFCSANYNKAGSNMELADIKNTHYNLVRKSFDPNSRSFGKTELVFNSSEMSKSASFPRISPDGKYLIFTLCNYGTFPIWHQEADLYMLNLENGKFKKMSLNSEKTESYHTWSSNSKWLVFSSKRLDGRSARPYFAYIGTYDHIGKPFVLPQKDPTIYNRMLETFNIPEFVNGRIKVKPRDFAAAAKQESIQAKPGNPLDTPPLWTDDEPNKKRSEIIRGIHE